MNTNIFYYPAMIAISLSCFSCSSSKNATSGSTTLKEAYKNDFLIGTALNAQQIEEKEPNAEFWCRSNLVLLLPKIL